MKPPSLPRLLLAIALLALAVFLLLQPPKLPEGSSTDPEPAWRIEWRGSTRYLWRDDRWHVWSSGSEWIQLPEGGSPDDPLGVR